MATFTTTKTKTWKRRHCEKLDRLKRQIEKWANFHGWSYQKPRVLHLGPGGIASNRAHLFPEGEEETMSTRNKRKLQLVTALESKSRDDKNVDLVTSEPGELYQILKETVGFSSYLIIDDNTRVLAAARRLIDEENLEGIELRQLNLERQGLDIGGRPYGADIVVGYKFFDYTKRYNALFGNVLRATKEGGLLGITIPDEQKNTSKGITQLDRDVYIKGDIPEKRRFELREGLTLPSDEDILKSMRIRN